jgi:hypothetical protein
MSGTVEHCQYRQALLDMVSPAKTQSQIYANTIKHWVSMTPATYSCKVDAADFWPSWVAVLNQLWSLFITMSHAPHLYAQPYQLFGINFVAFLWSKCSVLEQNHEFGAENLAFKGGKPFLCLGGPGWER